MMRRCRQAAEKSSNKTLSKVRARRRFLSTVCRLLLFQDRSQHASERFGLTHEAEVRRVRAVDCSLAVVTNQIVACDVVEVRIAGSFQSF